MTIYMEYIYAGAAWRIINGLNILTKRLRKIMQDRLDCGECLGLIFQKPAQEIYTKIVFENAKLIRKLVKPLQLKV